MCSGGDKTANSVEKSQAAFTDTLRQSFGTAFAANQRILDGLTAKMTDMMNNPQGFDPKTMALLKTSSSDTIARQVQQAQMSASAHAASHGGSDLGSGVEAQISGTIAGQGVEQQAEANTGIELSSEQLKQENFWKSIQGLTGVAQAENPTGYANAEVGSANAVADLSRSVLASKQAGWQNAFGVVSGIAGLGMAGVGAFNQLGFGGAKAHT